MSVAGLQPQGGFQPQRICGSPKIIHAQAAALGDAFEGTDGDGFASVHGHDHLPAIGVTPFLVAAFLADHVEAVPTEDAHHIVRGADWKADTHTSATSRTFDPLDKATGDGSNHKSRASFALRMASASVSPAVAQPGSSGKKADQRLVLGSRSTTRRSFMGARVERGPGWSKPAHHPISRLIRWGEGDRCLL